MEKPLETAWVGLQVGWGGVELGLRESPVWVKQDEPAWWSLRCGACLLALCGRGLRRGTMASASTFVWQEAAWSPPVLTLMPDNSILPCMSLVPFQPLPQLWSLEGVSQGKLVCRPFKRNT